jgi:hypothetical protein
MSRRHLRTKIGNYKQRSTRPTKSSTILAVTSTWRTIQRAKKCPSRILQSPAVEQYDTAPGVLKLCQSLQGVIQRPRSSKIDGADCQSAIGALSLKLKRKPSKVLYRKAQACAKRLLIHKSVLCSRIITQHPGTILGNNSGRHSQRFTSVSAISKS